MSYNGGIISVAFQSEPTTFESAQAQRKQCREFEKQRREDFRAAHYRGYENLTNLRGAWRKQHGL
jgi:hypothetical protein